MEKEKWLPIINYENLYEVSNYGNVKRKTVNVLYSNGIECLHKGRVLKQELAKGYKRVTLSKQGKSKRFLVHRLVALHFIENNEKVKCVNHIDGNKVNNNIKNLEWVTYSQNEKHSYKVLGKVNQNRKLTYEAILDIKKNCIKGTKGWNGIKGNVKHYSKKYNVNFSTILNLINNKTYA